MKPEAIEKLADWIETTNAYLDLNEKERRAIVKALRATAKLKRLG